MLTCSTAFLGRSRLTKPRNVAESTLTAIMGRISAYTGKMVRWTDITENKNSSWYNLTLKTNAEDFEKCEVEAPPDDIAAVPGRDK